MKRRKEYSKEHYNNAYGQRSEVNPFYGKIICGNCNYTYSRILYKDSKGVRSARWRCGSCNKAKGHKVCSNRYVKEDAFKKLFVISWNKIVENQEEYQEHWQKNIEGEDKILRFKTKLIMQQVLKGVIEDFVPDLMLMVMDYITVFEDGRLQIKFYDETVFEVETE